VTFIQSIKINLLKKTKRKSLKESINPIRNLNNLKHKKKLKSKSRMLKHRKKLKDWNWYKRRNNK